MTRKSSKAQNGNNGRTPKEKRWKEPENEPFRSLEELNEEFAKLKGAAFRSLGDLTKEFREQQQRPRISEAAHRAMEVGQRTPGTGVLKKAFEERGFGFIAPDSEDGSGDVFLHFSDLADESAKNLSVGARVRYEAEFDEFSGRLRAKSVAAISDTPDVREDVSSLADDSAWGMEMCPLPRTNSYNRDVMLTLFKAMTAHPVAFDIAADLKITTVPMPPLRRAADEQDPHLDDEHLIAKLEARLDKESGADARNMETFGACSGWTFEEALKANAKLRETWEAEESTVGESSRESPSTSEDNIDVTCSCIGDGRERRSCGVEAAADCDAWSWGMVFDESLKLWEVEEKHLSGDGLPKVFQ